MSALLVFPNGQILVTGWALYSETNGQSVQDLRFTGIARLPDGQVHLALRGYQSFPGVLQASSNLANWITLPDSLSEIDGLVYRDTVATNALQRFYRVVPAP